MARRGAGIASFCAAVLLLALAPAAAQPPAPAKPSAAPGADDLATLIGELEARQQANDVDAAAALIGRLVPLAAETVGGDDPDYLAALERWGEYLVTNARHGDAIAVMEALQAGRASALGPDHPETIGAAIYVSVQVSMHGNSGRAEQLMVAVATQAERALGPDHVQTLTALNNLGVLRQEQGRFAEAEPMLQRVVAARQRLLPPDDDDLMESVSRLGILYGQQGRFDEAEPLLRRVLDTRERTLGRQDAFTAYTMNALAQLYNLNGDHDRAAALYQQVEANAGAALGAGHPILLDAIDGRVFALLSTRRFAEAEPLARSLLEQRRQRQGADHPQTLRSAGNLAILYLNTDRPALAEPLTEQVMTSMERQLGPAHPDFLNAAENLVFTRLLIDPVDPRAMAPARQLLAGAQARRGDRPSSLYAQLQAGRERRRGNRTVRYTLYADAALALMQSRPDQQAQLLSEVFVALQESAAGEASASIARMATRSYVQQRGGDLAELVRERETLGNRWQTLSEAIAQSYVAVGDAAGTARTRLTTEREQVEARMAAIDARLEAAFPDYFQLVRPLPVDGPDAQRLVEPDEAILLVVPGIFGTHIVAIARDQAQWTRADWTDRQVRDAVERLRYDAGAQVQASAEQLAAWERARPPGDRPSFDRATAHALYREIVQPVESVLRGKNRVYVIAGDSLAGLPFSLLVAAPPQGADDDPAALRDTAWLADRYALVHVPSVQSLALLRGSRRGAGDGGFVGFGDPTLEGRAATRGTSRNATAPPAERVLSEARGGSGALLANVTALRALQQLPGTARELDEMRRVFGGGSSRVFTRAEATEARVRATDLANASVITFATHGLAPADPIGEALAAELFELAEPGLVLTPPAQASDADDGFLAASEVATLRLNADWVILSACNTASGDAATAGLSQLARAFFYAGARNLLASHWPVDDAVAARLTVRTVALERSGTPRADAFRQAMTEVRTDATHPEWAHPFYWAPFVLIGDGGAAAPR